MFGIGLSTIIVIFKFLGFIALLLFFVWLLVNGTIWTARFFIDNMGESFKGHGAWLKQNLVKILLPSLKEKKK